MKRIDRNRVETGKVELPRKLAFLTDEKVDYLAVIEREGDFSVELPAKSLAKMAKLKGELKTLKAGQKTATTESAAALRAEQEAHDRTREELNKALRQVKSLTKKLEASKSAAQPKSAGGQEVGSASSAQQADTAPVVVQATPAPAKVSKKKAVVKAMEAAAATAAEPALS